VSCFGRLSWPASDRHISLVAEGVSLSIDDFGTGYSSLSRLAPLPVGQLKIDKSFVSGLDPRCSRIVPAIILMAHSVGLSVVAEGVEEVAQFEALHRSGCDLIQGYFLGRPIGASGFTELVSADRRVMARYCF
jgi:EAL domain-containing protein (putative c-di-GMP-specific phosphodiesterase class I)